MKAGLHCPSCKRLIIPGLSKTQEEIVSRLAAARDPLMASELWTGLHSDVRSAAVQICHLRKKLKPHGFTISVNRGGSGHPGLYTIETIAKIRNGTKA